MNVSYVKERQPLAGQRPCEGVYFDDFSESILKHSERQANIYAGGFRGADLSSTVACERRNRSARHRAASAANGALRRSLDQLGGQCAGFLGRRDFTIKVARKMEAAGPKSGFWRNRLEALPNGSGNYEINVASGASPDRSASSSNWVSFGNPASA